MKTSPRRLVAGITLFIVSVWTAYHFGLVPTGPPSTKAATAIESSTVNGALPPDAGPQPVRLPDPKTKSVEETLRLKDELTRAVQSGGKTEFGPLLDRVVASAPAEPSPAFDQVIEQLLRFAQRGRKLTDDDHDVFPALCVRRLLPIYTPQDHLLTFVLVGQLPSDPLNDGKDWQATRQADVELGLRVWERAKSKVDPHYDPDAPENTALPFILLEVPDPQKRYGTGSQPNSIKEPEIRAAYEELIASHRAKHEKKLNQHDARESELRLRQYLEQYLERVFANPPDEVDELDQILAKHNFPIDHLADMKAKARHGLVIELKAIEREAANKTYLDELRATGRLKD